MSAYKRASHNRSSASAPDTDTHTITPLNIKNQVINNDIILINIRGGKSIHANVLTFGAEKGMR